MNLPLPTTDDTDHAELLEAAIKDIKAAMKDCGGDGRGCYNKQRWGGPEITTRWETCTGCPMRYFMNLSRVLEMP